MTPVAWAAAGGRFRRLRATVRFRVTALATLVLLAVLVTTGVALVVAQRRALTHDVDEGLARAADDVQALIAVGRVPDTFPSFGDDDAVTQVVDAEGVVLASTSNLAGLPAVAAGPGGGREALRTVAGLPHDPGPFRVLSRTVDSPGGPVTIHLGATLDDIDDSTRVLTTSLTVATPAVAALLAGLVWVVVGRTLRPVDAIRAEVAVIGGDGLHRRVPEPGTGDEIDRLAQTMNAMLDRLAAAAERQHRFVADASHELRSPLTRIRSELEVDLAHPAGADWAATHLSVLDEAAVLQRLVDDLLHLARDDAVPAGPARRDPVDLDDVTLGAVRRLRATDTVAVDIAGVAAVRILGDGEQLGRAVGNVVENAARHARTAVRLTVAETAGWAVLIVDDDGPGIPPADRERVFERFTRLDEARTAGTGGAGLGLAIARTIVERHGGTVSVEESPDPGARLVVRLPLDRSAPDRGGESGPAES